MGIYLTKPSSTVYIESNSNDNNNLLADYAVAEMQGWRKSMEDSHIASTNLKLSIKNLSNLLKLELIQDYIPSIDYVVNSESNLDKMCIFGVFDGHGGKQVSNFVKIKYLFELIALREFQNGNLEEALRKSFHRIDELLEEPVSSTCIKTLFIKTMY